MSSRARFSAFFASVLASASGFSTLMALLRLMPFSLGGASHDLMSPAGFVPVTSHFKQLNLIFRLWLTRSEATHSSRTLNWAQASFSVVRGGSSVFSNVVNFFSMSLFPASCWLAVGAGAFLIHLIGLYECSPALAAPARTPHPTIPTIVQMIHLFFIMASFQGRAWL